MKRTPEGSTGARFLDLRRPHPKDQHKGVEQFCCYFAMCIRWLSKNKGRDRSVVDGLQMLRLRPVWPSLGPANDRVLATH